MFVFFLEDIVRVVAERPEFTLPYWNYTSYDLAQRGVVPLQFRLATDPIFASLYRADRTTLAKTGQPIHKNQVGDAMDISAAMACSNYNTVGSVQGFCRAIDSGIHGRIHVLVGNSKNMGAVPYAARDPLFWVHHSNIDRLWASWNRNGAPNPTTGTWLNKEFVFADAYGQRVSCKLKDFFSTDVLGYTYDKFVSPTGTESAARTTGLIAPASAVAERVAKAATSAELGDKPVRAPWRRWRRRADKAVLGLDPTRNRRTYLVVKDLHAWAQPEVLYHLYLTPSRATGGLSQNMYVGNINFFDAEFHDHGHGKAGDALGENFYSFDVTDLLRRIARWRNGQGRRIAGSHLRPRRTTQSERQASGGLDRTGVAVGRFVLARRPVAGMVRPSPTPQRKAFAVGRFSPSTPCIRAGRRRPVGDEVVGLDAMAASNASEPVLNQIQLLVSPFYGDPDFSLLVDAGVERGRLDPGFIGRPPAQRIRLSAVFDLRQRTARQLRFRPAAGHVRRSGVPADVLPLAVSRASTTLTPQDWAGEYHRLLCDAVSTASAGMSCAVAAAERRQGFDLAGDRRQRGAAGHHVHHLSRRLRRERGGIGAVMSPGTSACAMRRWCAIRAVPTTAT